MQNNKSSLPGLTVLYGVKSWKWGSEHKWCHQNWRLSHARTCFYTWNVTKEQTRPLTTSRLTHQPLSLWCTAFTLSRGPLPTKFSPSGTSTTSPLRSFTKDWDIVTTCIIKCHTSSLVPRIPMAWDRGWAHMQRQKYVREFMNLICYGIIFSPHFKVALYACLAISPNSLCCRSICSLLATPRSS